MLPDGEQYKSLDVLQKVWDKALESRLDRNATFVALGGGVIGDMTGFAAAAYQRGVHFIQVNPCKHTAHMGASSHSQGGVTWAGMADAVHVHRWLSPVLSQRMMATLQPHEFLRCRCQQQSWPWWTLQWAERQESIILWGRT